MLELFMRSPLAGLSKSQSLKQSDNFPRLEDRRLHGSGHSDSLNADELGLELGRAVFQ